MVPVWGIYCISGGGWYDRGSRLRVVVSVCLSLTLWICNCISVTLSVILSATLSATASENVPPCVIVTASETVIVLRL